jgi:hypothetical protein
LTVIAAFSGLLFVFTVANLAIGVALAPRYAELSPDAVYGNNLAQQITSTFDVVVCTLSLAVLVVMLFTGPLAGYLIRRRDARIAAPAASSPAPSASAPPTAARPPQPAEMPRIVRLREDSTTVLAPPTENLSAPTAGLRILRRDRATEPTIQLSTPPDDAGEEAPPSRPVTDG